MYLTLANSARLRNQEVTGSQIHLYPWDTEETFLPYLPDPALPQGCQCGRKSGHTAHMAGRSSHVNHQHCETIAVFTQIITKL